MSGINSPQQNANNLEVWLQGPLPEVPPLLQPVAHALLQARIEVKAVLHDFPDRLLWERPAGVASAGFHLQHLSGVLDRLFTYAREEALTPEQMAAQAAEGKPTSYIPSITELVQAFDKQVDKAIAQLMATDTNQLTQIRKVGRAQLPSTLIGLLFHAAEHTTRHLGQLLVTVKVLQQHYSESH